MSGVTKQRIGVPGARQPSQRVLTSDEAVQPVIGTILLVAITVVIAAGIMFSIFQTTPDATKSAPGVSGIKDERADTWTLIDGADVPRSEFAIRADGAGIRYSTGGEATAASPLLSQEWTQLSGDAPWAAGTRYYFCADTPGAAFEFQVYHEPSRQLVEKAFFSEVAGC